jgi:hypothetical protein
MDRSWWPRRLRRGPAAARFLWLWVRIPPEAWMSVSCERWLLSGRSICDVPILHLEESYRVCVRVCICVCHWVRFGADTTLCTYSEQVQDVTLRKKEERCVMAKQIKYCSQWYLYTRFLSHQASLGRVCRILYCSHYTWQRQRILSVSLTNHTAAPTSNATHLTFRNRASYI